MEDLRWDLFSVKKKDKECRYIAAARKGGLRIVLTNKSDHTNRLWWVVLRHNRSVRRMGRKTCMSARESFGKIMKCVVIPST